MDAWNAVARKRSGDELTGDRSQVWRGRFGRVWEGDRGFLLIPPPTRGRSGRATRPTSSPQDDKELPLREQGVRRRSSVGDLTLFAQQRPLGAAGHQVVAEHPVTTASVTRRTRRCDSAYMT